MTGLEKLQAWQRGFFEGKSVAYQLASEWIMEDLNPIRLAKLAETLERMAKKNEKLSKEKK